MVVIPRTVKLFSCIIYNFFYGTKSVIMEILQAKDASVAKEADSGKEAK